MARHFRSACDLLKATPLARWVSIVASVASSVVTVMLIPVVFLVVDLLVRGSGPSTGVQGVQSTITAHEGHWCADLLGFFSSWNPWMESNGYYLFGLFLLASFLILLRALLINASAYYACEAACSAANRIRRNIYNQSYRIGALAIRPELQSEAGELISTEVDALQDGYLAWLNSAFRNLALAGLALVILLLIHPLIGLACLLLIGTLWLVAGQFVHWFRRDARLAARRIESRLAMLRESLTHMLLVKSYLTERFSQTRIERQINDLTRTTRRRLRGETVSRQVLFMLFLLSASLLVFLAGRAILLGSLTFAGMTAQACALGIMVAGLSRWVSVRVRIRRADAAGRAD